MNLSDLNKIIGEIIGVKQNIETLLKTVVDSSQYPEDKLSNWLRKKQQTWLSLIIALASLLTIANFIHGLFPEFLKKLGIKYIIIIHLVHLFVIIIAIINLVLNQYKKRYHFTEETKVASISTGNLLIFWLYTWVSWFFLYLYQIGISMEIPQILFISKNVPALSNFINNLSGIFLFAMFYEMYSKTIVTHQE